MVFFLFIIPAYYLGQGPMSLRKFQTTDPSLLLQKRMRQVATNTSQLVQSWQGGAHRREQTRIQQALLWQKDLCKELDAGVGRLTYDETFHRLGEPQFTMQREQAIAAVWVCGRLRSRWVPLNRPWLTRLFRHGYRLELIFDSATRLISWKYTDW